MGSVVLYAGYTRCRDEKSTAREQDFKDIYATIYSFRMRWLPPSRTDYVVERANFA